MKERILNLLKENKGSFISGQKISEELDVTRTAIWKYINQLKQEGYEIGSVSRKGYRLLSTPDILTYEEIKEGLNTKYIGKEIIYFDSIDSTNIKAKELAAYGKEQGVVIIAEEQNKGRGRLGRNWISPKKNGIWMSIILRPDINPMDAAKVTQIGAAAVSKSITELGVENHIKWPNDLVVNGKKICGILTEMNGELNIINYMVIGIGINVNIESDEFPKDLREIATSLKIEYGKEIVRKDLVAKILNNFEYLYDELIQQRKISRSLEICRKSSAILGKKIIIATSSGKINAKAIDLTDEGELLIEDEGGQLKKLISGEVSIRGLNGYV